MMGLAVRWPAGSIRWATTPVVIDGPAKRARTSRARSSPPATRNLTTDVVTHSVAELRDGFIHTKGDANRTADVWDIRPNQVQGIFVMKLPHLGYLLVFLRRPAGVASLVIGGLALMLLWGLRNPSTQKRAPSKSASKPAPSTPPTQVASVSGGTPRASRDLPHGSTQQTPVGIGDATAGPTATQMPESPAKAEVGNPVS
jgi:hypothetical protein